MILFNDYNNLYWFDLLSSRFGGRHTGFSYNQWYELYRMWHHLGHWSFYVTLTKIAGLAKDTYLILQ